MIIYLDEIPIIQVSNLEISITDPQKGLFSSRNVMYQACRLSIIELITKCFLDKWKTLVVNHGFAKYALGEPAPTLVKPPNCFKFPLNMILIPLLRLNSGVIESNFNISQLKYSL